MVIVAVVFGGAGAWQVLAKRSEKTITSFEFLSANNDPLCGDVTAKISGTTISATVPPGTDIGALVATFETTGARVSVGDIVQTSGTSRNDFSGPVQYTVTAANDSTQTYTVTISNMLAIEASLAMKKTKVTQPQKPHETPPPVVIEGRRQPRRDQEAGSQAGEER